MDRREFVKTACGAVIVAGIRPWARAASRQFTEVGRFDAAEARQGVAVDADHVYVVDSTNIAKYDKKTRRLVQRNDGPPEGTLIHLDSGAVVEGKLYCAHSNYPEIPMTSSVEIWDTRTMKHAGNHSVGVMWGSCTWIDRHLGSWWAVFANYDKPQGPEKLPYGYTRSTTLVKLDDQWMWKEAWLFPEQVLKNVRPMSVSGGSWGPDGYLYCTGHDPAEVYVLRLPKAGSILELVDTVPCNIAGQGIAWDRTEAGMFYGIVKSRRQVVVSRFTAS